MTEIAGTTRDTVEETLHLGALVLRLQDTAGLRETDDPVEKIGVTRAARPYAWRRERRCAGRVRRQPPGGPARTAWSCAPSRAQSALWLWLNKADLPRADGWEALHGTFAQVVPLSAKKREGLGALTDTLTALTGVRDLPADGGLITNLRQAETLSRTARHLDEAAARLREGYPPDAVVYDIEGAIESLGEITGQSVQADIVDHIFANFCVGK